MKNQQIADKTRDENLFLKIFKIEIKYKLD